MSGGGGGGGGGGASIWSGSVGDVISVPRGAMHSLTASTRSSASTMSLPLSAACARAASTAKISPRLPCTPARIAFSQRYFSCSRLSERPLRYSRAKMMLVLMASEVSSKSLMTFCGSVENSSARCTASSRSSLSRGIWSAESVMPIRSMRCSLSSASSGLKVAMRRGLQGWRTERPSRSTVTQPVESASSSRLEIDSSRRLMSST
mmetsp:Transcript_21002/g.36006  ORF Transcript_21002/g.36006 Transcript_21002/m.36006 type:complete len:206 (+) Transcript_21002:108-725(+)